MVKDHTNSIQTSLFCTICPFNFFQADTVMEKKMLLETLNELSSEELQEFMSLIHEDKSFPLAPEKRLELKNAQDFVELMEKTYGQECVEMTRKVLQMMNRDDLAMSLSDTSLRFKGKRKMCQKQTKKTVSQAYMFHMHLFKMER